MATINYLPSFPISDRVFPCPRKHMLIYGQKPPSPPPATLTQEQLARDAGQLVEAHVLLDKLCDDTDRSQHSLVHRLKQIVYGSEEMNKVLEKAGFNTAAGLLECVRALAQRHPRVQAAHLKLNTVEQISTFGTIDERVASLVDLFKARVASVAVPPEYDKRYHEKLNELPEIERTGTLLERVTQVVDLFKARGAVLDEIRGHLIRACQTLRVSNPAGMHTTGLAQTVNEELARSPRITLARIPSIKLVDECFRLLDKAGIPNGTLCERVRVAIERGQQAKVAPDAAHCVKIVEECTRKLTQADVPTGNLLDRIQLLINDRAALLNSKTSYGVSPTLDEKAWEVRNRDNRVMAVCTSLADAQRIRASLEAR